ncbi:MAG: aminomethyl-transferring glycine dehydrogenase subunit GcvPA [Euryarchaeota archaeon]|nr:aminomethyl-transferring glycine dehydrogenase subunit GcvPA [Euryarchaeota archaeon]MDE1836329.1 aminomethyl-transferring glycine dehydrogenase subunit GcvPA [Euryarchaeota archaeon]MDE1879127.1 aminomethyl-transferring glycine dehydrogenase subunit GcvPA [Euryarchaeota archaeon]MDE2044275.1 aminomethyl-transferring glycine dehydrogenase subunit GcvPA [Thermoplasmata archaeon]
MVRWIPGDGEEEKALLAELGLSSIEELFRDVPAAARMSRMGLGAPLEEPALVAAVDRILSKNQTLGSFDAFLGCGLYDRYVPAVVDGILQRSEFYTAYTPYQPEASQGVLQTLFEFQSLWVELTDMEVANASLYDGATALGEAMLMARRLAPGHRFLVPSNLFWERRSVLENYTPPGDCQLVEVPVDSGTGRLDLEFIAREARNDCFGVLVEYPDSYGIVEEGLLDLRRAIGDTPLVVSTDPLALTLLEPPGAWGADIVVGEGQGFGISPSFGGPLLGLIASRHRSLRMLPGRIVGATTDVEGRRAFTLTLQAREQHIRRSRATSNICTNQTLMSLAFLAYATALGPKGLARLAGDLTEKAHRLASALARVPGLAAPLYDAPFLWEFVLGTGRWDPREFLEAMERRGVLAGVWPEDPRAGRPSLAYNGVLVAAGERTDDEAIERYRKAAEAVVNPAPPPEEP